MGENEKISRLTYKTKNMKPETMKYLHSIGRRDACAEILMMAREKSPTEVLKEIATQMLTVDAKHPHARCVLANL